MHVRNGGGRPKIDWLAARSWFATNPTASLGDVAKKWGVSETAVRNHAGPEGWAEYRASLQAEVAKRVNGRDLRTLEERNRRTLQGVDAFRDKFLAGLDQDTIEVKASDFPAMVKLEQLIEGAATGRLEAVEVTNAYHHTLTAIMQMVALVVAELLPQKYQAPLVAEVRRRIPATVDDALEGLAA